MERPPKEAKIIERVRSAVAERKIKLSLHAMQRMREREIRDSELLWILVNGFHESRKDEFSHDGWAYAIRGKTVDGRNLRIAVGFKFPGLIVITAIDLDKE